MHSRNFDSQAMTRFIAGFMCFCMAVQAYTEDFRYGNPSLHWSSLFEDESENQESLKANDELLNFWTSRERDNTVYQSHSVDFAFWALPHNELKWDLGLMPASYSVEPSNNNEFRLIVSRHAIQYTWKLQENLPDFMKNELTTSEVMSFAARCIYNQGDSLSCLATAYYIVLNQKITLDHKRVEALSFSLACVKKAQRIMRDVEQFSDGGLAHQFEYNPATSLKDVEDVIRWAYKRDIPLESKDIDFVSWSLPRVVEVRSEHSYFQKYGKWSYMRELVKRLPPPTADQTPNMYGYCFIYHVIDACVRGASLTKVKSESKLLAILHESFNNAVDILQEEAASIGKIEKAIRDKLGLNAEGFWKEAVLKNKSRSPKSILEKEVIITSDFASSKEVRR